MQIYGRPVSVSKLEDLVLVPSPPARGERALGEGGDPEDLPVNGPAAFNVAGRSGASGTNYEE